MKIKATFILLFAAVVLSAQPQQGPQGQREDRRTKVIVINDLCGDADGLFALAHQLWRPRYSCTLPAGESNDGMYSNVISPLSLSAGYRESRMLQ